MTRQLRRYREFEVTLNLKQDEFIAPPRAAQRSWLVSRTMKELCDELQHLDAVAGTFVGGSEGVRFEDRTQAERDQQAIMEDWQIPIVTAMSRVAARGQGHVLEVGFGRGVSAEVLQAAGIRKHTIVECNDMIVEQYRAWRATHLNADIELLHGLWQDQLHAFEMYDAILFHTYPLDEAEFIERVVKGVTFASNFFGVAAEHLRPGGSFTYVTNERDSLSRAHQRLLFEHFSSFSLQSVGPLHVPPNTQDSFWADAMIVVDARK